MNLAEYRAKRSMLEKEARNFAQIKPGCINCLHNDLWRCALADEPIPQEFMAQLEQCELWERDDVPF